MVTAVSHVAIDRTKVVLTRRAAAAALREARERHEGPQPPEHLGRAWTPRPAALFLADQGAHLAVSGGGWAVLLAGVPLDRRAGRRAVDGWLGGWDRVAVHRRRRAAPSSSPRSRSSTSGRRRCSSGSSSGRSRPASDGDHRWGGRARRQRAGRPGRVRRTWRSPGLRDRRRPGVGRSGSGPLDARVTAEPERAAASATAAGRAASSAAAGAVGASARVGATIGILERILIVVFVLTGTDVAIGFVVAAKTLARFRLLDDRAFAEYYLLGTLASVAVAIVSALVGRAALTALLG